MNNEGARFQRRALLKKRQVQYKLWSYRIVHYTDDVIPCLFVQHFKCDVFIFIHTRTHKQGDSKQGSTRTQIQQKSEGTWNVFNISNLKGTAECTSNVTSNAELLQKVEL